MLKIGEKWPFSSKLGTCFVAHKIGFIFSIKLVCYGIKKDFARPELGIKLNLRYKIKSYLWSRGQDDSYKRSKAE